MCNGCSVRTISPAAHDDTLTSPLPNSVGTLSRPGATLLAEMTASVISRESRLRPGRPYQGANVCVNVNVCLSEFYRERLSDAKERSHVELLHISVGPSVREVRALHLKQIWAGEQATAAEKRTEWQGDYLDRHQQSLTDSVSEAGVFIEPTPTVTRGRFVMFRRSLHTNPGALTPSSPRTRSGQTRREAAPPRRGSACPGLGRTRRETRSARADGRTWWSLWPK